MCSLQKHSQVSLELVEILIERLSSIRFFLLKKIGKLCRIARIVLLQTTFDSNIQRERQLRRRFRSWTTQSQMDQSTNHQSKWIKAAICAEFNQQAIDRFLLIQQFYSFNINTSLTIMCDYFQMVANSILKNSESHIRTKFNIKNQLQFDK